jgi:hypothetical protein
MWGLSRPWDAAHTVGGVARHIAGAAGVCSGLYTYKVWLSLACGVSVLGMDAFCELTPFACICHTASCWDKFQLSSSSYWLVVRQHPTILVILVTTLRVDHVMQRDGVILAAWLNCSVHFRCDTYDTSIM